MGRAPAAYLPSYRTDISISVTKHGEEERVVTAYDLDAGPRRDYYKRGTQGE